MVLAARAASSRRDARLNAAKALPRAAGELRVSLTQARRFEGGAVDGRRCVFVGTLGVG